MILCLSYIPVQAELTVPLTFTDSSGFDYAACSLTVSGVMVLACTNQYFVFNTNNFLATGLKGIKDWGAAGSPGVISHVVDKKDRGQLSALVSKGYDSEVGYYLGSVTLFTPTQASVGSRNFHRQADLFKFTFAEYEFSQKMGHAVVFDTDYVVLCTGTQVGFIQTKGMQKLINNEKFGDVDLQGKFNAPGTVVMMRGYSIAATDTTEYKRMLWTVQREGSTYTIRNYELVPGKDAQTEGTLAPGSDYANLGGNEPTSLAFDDKYLVIGYSDAGYGRIEVRDRSTLNTITYQASGDSAHRNLGRDVAIHMSILQPGSIEAHYIHYGNMQYESERVSFFHNGLITLITTDKTVTTTSSKPEVQLDKDSQPVIDEDGQLVTKLVEVKTTKVVPELSSFRNDEDFKLAVSTIRGRASKWAAMGYYNNELIMKQEQSLTLEVAAACANDQTVDSSPLGSDYRLAGKPVCLPCTYDKDDLLSPSSGLFSLGSRAGACDSCAVAYPSRNGGGITGLLYKQYCKAYTPPPPPQPTPDPVAPKPAPVIVKPPDINPKPVGPLTPLSPIKQAPDRQAFVSTAVAVDVSKKDASVETAIFAGGGAITLALIASCWLYRSGRCCWGGGGKGARRTSIVKDDLEKNTTATQGRMNTGVDTTRAALKDDDVESARDAAKRTGRPSPDTEIKLKHADASDQKDGAENDSLAGLDRDKSGAKSNGEANGLEIQLAETAGGPEDAAQKQGIADKKKAAKQNAGCFSCLKANPKAQKSDELAGGEAGRERRGSTFKQKMTKEELLKKEQEEMEEIRQALEAQGMDPEEIERHVKQLKGEDSEKQGAAVQLGDIVIDGWAEEALHTPIELDEAAMRSSVRTDNIAKKKTKKLDLADLTPGQQKREKIQAEDALGTGRSYADRKPKLRAKVKTGMHDNGSIKAGSVDADDSESGRSAAGSAVPAVQSKARDVLPIEGVLANAAVARADGTRRSGAANALNDQARRGTQLTNNSAARRGTELTKKSIAAPAGKGVDVANVGKDDGIAEMEDEDDFSDDEDIEN